MIAMRVFQGVVGIAIMVMGILDQSWWGAFGLLPLWNAVTGNCGCCGDACALPPQGETDEKSAS
jgi:hypothetical protein